MTDCYFPFLHIFLCYYDHESATPIAPTRMIDDNGLTTTPVVDHPLDVVLFSRETDGGEGFELLFVGDDEDVLDFDQNRGRRLADGSRAKDAAAAPDPQPAVGKYVFFHVTLNRMRKRRLVDERARTPPTF